jgi:hypothetical protein
MLRIAEIRLRSPYGNPMPDIRVTFFPCALGVDQFLRPDRKTKLFDFGTCGHGLVALIWFSIAGEKTNPLLYNEAWTLVIG